MAARWIALMLALATFTIVGFFVVIALRPAIVPADPASGPGLASMRMTSRTWTVSTEIAWRPTGVEAMVSVRDVGGRPPATLRPPLAQLRMLDMAMPPVAIDLKQQAPGVWRGTGRVPMPGRWSFVVTIEGEELAFPFPGPDEPRSAS